MRGCRTAGNGGRAAPVVAHALPDNRKPERQEAADERLTATISGAGAAPTGDRSPMTAPSKRPPRPARSIFPARRQIARTATSAMPPRFSIARADTIDRSADNITYTPTSQGAPPFTRSNAVATIGVRPLAKMPDTW